MQANSNKTSMNKLLHPIYLIVVLLLFFTTVSLSAQDKDPKMEATLLGGLNSNDAWEVEAAFTYYFLPYLGGTLGIGFTEQYSEEGYSGIVQHDSKLKWHINDDDIEVFKLLLRPAIRLSTPAFQFGRDKDLGLRFHVEPGLQMAVPANEKLSIDYRLDDSYQLVKIESVSNKGGDWLFWNVRGFFSLDLDEFSISAGYSLSNFDIYSGRRQIVIENKRLNDLLPSRKLTHTGFIALSYRF